MQTGPWILAAGLLVCFTAVSAYGEDMATLRMPGLFTDNMALQAGIEAPVWGWDRPGQEVVVKVAGQEKSAVAGEDGKWMLKLDPLKAGLETEMVVKGSNEITLKNVIVGDVWLCAGQSNMNFGLGGATDGLTEIRKAHYPRIRIFAVPLHSSPDKELDDIGEPWGSFRGTWLECDPSTIGAFSAVSYYFGRDVHRETGIPLGLIVTIQGGVSIDKFFSWDMLRDNPVCEPLLKKAETWLQEKLPEKQAEYDAAMAEYEKAKALPIEVKEDAGWESPDLDDSEWERVTLPKNGLSLNGVAWHRRTIRIPDAWRGKKLLLKPGIMADVDTTYVNGRKLGKTNGWTVPREYAVPAELTSSGTLAIAIRVESFGGWNVIRGKPEQFEILPIGIDGATPVSLAGEWGRRVAVSRPVMPIARGMQYNPASAFNAMVAPLIPYGIRGFLWYQGESGGLKYDETFPILIKGYRDRWGLGDIPFLYVQLPNLHNPDPKVEASWISVREAQLKTLSVTNTGMAVSIDVGDPHDVHYANKEPVGQRLARWALANVYGKDIVYSGPIYESMTIEGNKIRLRFKYVDGGLVAKGGNALSHFLIAGEDRNFVPATATIDGDTVLVSHPDISNPAAVRYAWRINPQGCNLYNKAGLPASPFRTDDW